MKGLGAIVALAAVATIGFGNASAKPAPRTVAVTIDKLAFGQIPRGLHVGDTILWSNHDLFRHSVTAQGHFNLDLAAGATGRMMLGKAGTFPFTCKYHPGMKGVLRVSP